MENHSLDSRLIGRAENVQAAECTQRFNAKIGHALFHSLFQYHVIMGTSLTGLSITFEVASSFWKVGVSLLSERRNSDALKCYFRRFPDSIWALKNNQNKTILTIFAPAGFWPRGQNPRRHYRNPRVIENMYGITRKNLESQEQGLQRISG